MLFKPTDVAGSLADAESMRYLSKGTDVQCLKMSYYMDLEAGSNTTMEYVKKSIRGLRAG